MHLEVDDGGSEEDGSWTTTDEDIEEGDNPPTAPGRSNAGQPLPQVGGKVHGEWNPPPGREGGGVEGLGDAHVRLARAFMAQEGHAEVRFGRVGGGAGLRGTFPWQGMMGGCGPTPPCDGWAPCSRT